MFGMFQIFFVFITFFAPVLFSLALSVICRIRRGLVTMTDSSQYVLPNDQPVVSLDCEEAFNALTDQEKLYAHHLSQAAWTGGLIVFVQVLF